MDNLPQVPPEKQEKLAAVIKRLYAQIGTIREGVLSSPVTLRLTTRHIQIAQMLFKTALADWETGIDCYLGCLGCRRFLDAFR